MNFKDQQMLEEAYLDIFARYTLGEDIQGYSELVELDQQAFDELIQEAFGDWLKQKAGQAGQAIKAGAQAAKQAVSNSVIQTVINTFTKKYSNVIGDILVKLIQASDGKVDPQLNKAAKQIVGSPVAAGQPTDTVKESLHYQNKTFLASLIFTENNVVTILESLNQQGLLTEAKSKRELERYAKEVAAKINQIYPKNKQSLSAALPGFFDNVSKKLGVSPTASGSSAAAAPASASSAAMTTKPTPVSSTGSAPTGGGLISKVMTFIKDRPVVSGIVGVAILGLVVSAFAGSAPVIVPALLTGLKGALTGAGGNLLIQVLKNKFAGNPAFKDIDWSQVGKTGLAAGALGAVGKVLTTGLGYIVNAFDPITIKSTQRWNNNGAIGGVTTETPGIRGASSWTGNAGDAHMTGPSKVTDSYGNYRAGNAVARR